MHLPNQKSKIRNQKWLVAGLAVLLMSVTYAQVKPASRPTTEIPTKSCVTAECHADVKAYAYVHAPAASNDCESCHELTSAEKHTFKTPREKAEMCVFCHEFSATKMPVVHKPVTQGECLGCHNPHGGTSRASLREKTVQDLCNSCHENVGHGKSFLHGPVAQGACDSCHPPHASKFPKLLDVVGTDLCLTCHKEIEPALAKAKYKHKALEDGCEKCHDAHGSNSPMSLSQTQPGLCLDCHEDMAKKIKGSEVAHTAISKDRMCMNCHAPHASNAPKLQSDTQVKTCMTCHNKAIQTDRGYTVAATPEVANAKLLRHGEIRDGQCAGCHDLHGGERKGLLKKPFTDEFYKEFAADNYALCFSCHDIALAQAEKTSAATAFRNGSQNLHWVHANSGERDKNCRTCHASHATANDRLVRPTFHFGKRDLPIAFTKTATGGTCTPGCHAEYPYDRERAVPKPAPTTQTAAATKSTVTPLPRAERSETRFVTWSAKDIAGKDINIPDQQKRATALVVLSGTQRTSAKLAEKLQSALRNDADARLVFLIVGETSAKELEAITRKAANASIILDPTHAASSALEARAWPMALVLRADGLELARVAGDPDFFVTKLKAYLDVAAGRTDKAAAATQLSTPPVTEASATQQAARDLRVARSLLDQHKPELALRYLGDPRRAAPEAMALRAEALLQLDKANEALGLIEGLPASVIPQPRIDLLRARALVAQQRWYLARPLLEKYVVEHEGVAEAHLLLARIYEHDENWPKAAEQYRAATPAK